MLSLFSMADVPSAAMRPRVRLGAGTWLRCGASSFGNAAQADFAQQQRTSNNKYAHTMTRIAPAGGVLGPHSARDPV